MIKIVFSSRCSLVKLRETGQLTFIDGLKHVLDSWLDRPDCLLHLDPVESEDLARLYAEISRDVREGGWIIVDNISALLYLGISER